MITKVYVDAATGETLREEVVEEKSPWMRVEEAARYHDVTVWTIHEWCRKGLLTKYRVKGVQNVRLKRDEVEGLFEPVPAGVE